MSYIPKFYYLPRNEWPEGSKVFEEGENYWTVQSDNINSNKEYETETQNQLTIEHLNSDEQKRQYLLKKIMGILNKITPDRFKTLMEVMKSESVDVKMLAETLFSKILVDEMYLELYVKLCKEIMTELSVENGIYFKEIIAYLCETGVDNLLVFTDEDFCNIQEDKRFLFRRRLMTMMRFIGEMSSTKDPLFSHKYVCKIAELLLAKKDGIHAEALYFLMFTCSLRNPKIVWPQSIESEVEKILKYHIPMSSVSAPIESEVVERKSTSCLPCESRKTESDGQCCSNVSSSNKDNSLNAAETIICNTNILHNLVIVSLDVHGNIKPAEIALIKTRIELISKSIDCFNFQMNNSFKPIVSFSDTFSYNWFISHLNQQKLCETKLICIDLNKYDKTSFISIVFNCDFAKGLELFSKTELEILKIINESNDSVSTSNWSIVEVSVKCILQSYSLQIAALIDSDSLKVICSLNYSIKIGSNSAHVYTLNLPDPGIKENEIDLKAMENEVKCIVDQAKEKELVDNIKTYKTLDCSKKGINEKGVTNEHDLLCENKEKLLDSSSVFQKGEIDKFKINFKTLNGSNEHAVENYLTENQDQMCKIMLEYFDSTVAGKSPNRKTDKKSSFNQKPIGSHSFNWKHRKSYKKKGSCESEIHEKCCCMKEERTSEGIFDTSVINDCIHIERPSTLQVNNKDVKCGSAKAKKNNFSKGVVKYGQDNFCSKQGSKQVLGKKCCCSEGEARNIENTENVIDQPSTSKISSYRVKCEPTIKPLMSCTETIPHIKSNIESEHKRFPLTKKLLRNNNTKCCNCGNNDAQSCHQDKTIDARNRFQFKRKNNYSKSRRWKGNNNAPSIKSNSQKNGINEPNFTSASCGEALSHTRADFRKGDEVTNTIKTPSEQQTIPEKSNKFKEKDSSQDLPKTSFLTPPLKFMGKPLLIGKFRNSSQYEDNQIFEIINNSNKMLGILEPTVVCRFDQGNSVQLTFSIDDLTFKILQKNEFQVRYHTETVLVKPLTSWSEAMSFNN